MSIAISIKYLKGKEDNLFYPIYIIEPPARVPELEGYVLKISQAHVTVKDKIITLSRGNEWNKKEKKFLYTFEKEIKEKGRAFKKYRYTEEEALLLYRKGESKNFEQTLKKREGTATKGPGSLVKISFSEYIKSYGYVQKKDWFIMPKEETTWVYPFDYDPLRDVGKHKVHARGFSVLEEYPVEDIAILHIHAKELKKLLYSLDLISELHNETFAEHIMSEALRLMPMQSSMTKEQKKELFEVAEVVEEKCNNFINGYKKAEKKRVAEEIKALVGIDIDQEI